MMEQIMKLSDGNPGAMSCLMGLLGGDIENSVAGLTIIPRIEELGIRGTNLYIMWSDLCGKDYRKMVELCENCPSDVLIAASSSQDYSGKVLIEEYFENVEG